MPRRSNYLSKWEVALYVTAAVLLLPASLVYDWLYGHRPRLALAIYILLNVGFLTLVAFLAYGAWLTAVASYREHRSRRAQTFGRELRVPISLYFAIVLTIGFVGGVIHLVHEAMRRAT